MATTATITLSSDIMPYSGYSKTMTLTQGGTITDIDSTTGFQRRKLTSTTATDLVIMADASLIVETKDSAAAKIYIKNTGYNGVIDKTTYVSISLGTAGGTTQEISKLYGGDWLMVPLTGIDATGDVYATSETNDAVVLEYVMYYEEN